MIVVVAPDAVARAAVAAATAARCRRGRSGEVVRPSTLGRRALRRERSRVGAGATRSSGDRCGAMRRRAARRRRPDRCRRLGRRLEPARAGRRGAPGRARRRRRARVRGPAVPGARLGGGAGDRDGARAAAATTPTLADDAPGRRRPTSSSWPATCASSARAMLGGVRRPDPQHRTRRSCRRSPAPTPCATRLTPGVAVHRRHASTSSTRRSTAGPIVAQEAVPVLPADDEASLHERIQAVEHRLLPARRRGAARGRAPARRPVARVLDAQRAARGPRPPPRPPVGLRQAGLVDLGRGLVGPRLRARVDRRHGPVAARCRPAGDRRGGRDRLRRRCSTGGSRRSIRGSTAGILADRRLAEHRAAARRGGIAPFELVVVNLYPFAAAARATGHHRSTSSSRRSTSAARRSSARRRRTTPRVAIVTSPARYDESSPRSTSDGEVPLGLRARARRRGVPPHRRLRRADRRGAARPDGRAPGSRCPTSRVCPGASTRTRPR